MHRTSAPINRKCPADYAGTGNNGGSDGHGTSEIPGRRGAGRTGWLDLDASIDKTIALDQGGSGKGAKLIAFPEAFIPGYPWYIWMNSPAWAIGRGFVQRYFDNSLSYDSPQAESCAMRCGKRAYRRARPVRARGRQPLPCAMADRARRRDHRETPQAAADPCRAHRLWRGRRQRPCGPCAPGIGRLGALCCWEHLQPLSKYAMYAQNEQVHVAAWPSFSLYDRSPGARRGVNNAARASMRSRAPASCWRLARRSRRR